MYRRARDGSAAMSLDDHRPVRPSPQPLTGPRRAGHDHRSAPCRSDISTYTRLPDASTARAEADNGGRTGEGLEPSRAAGAAAEASASANGPIAIVQQIEPTTIDRAKPRGSPSSPPSCGSQARPVVCRCKGANSSRHACSVNRWYVFAIAVLGWVGRDVPASWGDCDQLTAECGEGLDRFFVGSVTVLLRSWPWSVWCAVAAEASGGRCC